MSGFSKISIAKSKFKIFIKLEYFDKTLLIALFVKKIVT